MYNNLNNFFLMVSTKYYFLSFDIKNKINETTFYLAIYVKKKEIVVNLFTNMPIYLLSEKEVYYIHTYVRGNENIL